MPCYFELAENEAALAAFVCSREADWAESLTAESLLDIWEAAARAKFRECAPLGRTARPPDRGAAASGRDGHPRAASLGELCADCALLLGKAPAEIAQTLSLPKLMLLLKRHDRRESERLLVQMEVAFLSAAAPWSPKAGRALERWRGLL